MQMTTIFMCSVLILACLVIIGESDPRPPSTTRRGPTTRRSPITRTPRTTRHPPPTRRTTTPSSAQNMFPPTANFRGTHGPKLAETNTFDLPDNCYYTTLAGIKGKTVDMLIKETEIMQHSTAHLDEIRRLYKAAKLPIHHVYVFNSLADTISFFEHTENIHEKSIVIPFAYQINRSLNHMVALRVRRLPNKNLDGLLEDFQLKHDDPKRIQHKFPQSSKYFVFDTFGFDARMT
jgi:hypothetical protein